LKDALAVAVLDSARYNGSLGNFLGYVKSAKPRELAILCLEVASRVINDRLLWGLRLEAVDFLMALDLNEIG
jgi:hypothetical protein